MQIKKRVGVLLLITIFLLTLIPSVFALFENLVSAFYAPPDLRTLYFAWQTWIDAAVFFLVFASAARIGYTRIYGKDGKEPAGATGLYLGIGLFASLGLTLFLSARGLSLFDFGPLILIVFIILFIALMYQFLTKQDSIAILPAVILLILALIIMSELFPGLLPFGLLPPWLIPAAILVGIILLLLWVIKGAGGTAGGSAGASAAAEGLGGLLKGAGAAGEGLGKGIGKTLSGAGDIAGELGGRGAERLKAEKLDVVISTFPLISTFADGYPLGQTLSITGKVFKIKGALFLSSKEDVTGQGFHFAWNVGGIDIEDSHTLNNQSHGPTITYKIPNDAHITQKRIRGRLRNVLNISVVATNLTDGSIQALGSEDVVVDIRPPQLIIKQPIDTATGNRTHPPTNNGTNLTFNYRIEGSIPKAVSNARWLYVPGHVTDITPEVISHATRIRDSDGTKPFTTPLGTAPLDLPQGMNTIICVALFDKNKVYVSPFNNKPLLDFFHIEVTEAIGTTEFHLNVLDKDKNEYLRADPNFASSANIFIANIGDKFYFLPEATRNTNNVTSEYEINIIANDLVTTGPNKDKFGFGANHNPPTAAISLRSPGTKKIVCTFSKNGNVEATIEVPINVQTELPVIKIIKPKTKEDTVDTSTPYTVYQNQNLDVEATVVEDLNSQIKNIFWSLKEAAGGFDTVDERSKGTILNQGAAVNVNIPDTLAAGPYYLIATAITEDGSGNIEAMPEVYDVILVEVKEALKPTITILDADAGDAQIGNVINLTNATTAHTPLDINHNYKLLGGAEGIDPADFASEYTIDWDIKSTTLPTAVHITSIINPYQLNQSEADIYGIVFSILKDGNIIAQLITLIEIEGYGGSGASGGTSSGGTGGPFGPGGPLFP